MKVLFVGNPSARPTDGGSATFHESLLAGLGRAQSSHELSYAQPIPGKNGIQALVAERRVDFVWFMSPYYEPVEVPFAATVWDLGHRQAPYFPELSLSGWTFDQREAYYRYVLPRAAIVVIGNGVGARLVSGFYQVPPENICEIPLPVDAARLRGTAADPGVVQRLGLTRNQYLFYPAQFWPHKNHVTLVDAVKVLRERGRHFRLVFSGSDKGNRAHVESYVARCELRDEVLFAGFVETAVLEQLYLNAFATVFGSLLGPDNLPPLEALAHGCPVVCAEYAGAREQLGEAALFFDALDPQEAASQVLRLDDPQLRERLLSGGRALVEACSPEQYFLRINAALDRFAVKRRLWAPGSSYRHL